MNAKPHKSKIVVILGPTSVGKSDFAIALAKKYNGEIISADSRQVYTGATLLSGAVTEPEREAITHHLISIASLKKNYNVNRFVRDSKKKIKQIERVGKLPIICGGTAMYIDALLYNQVFPEVKPDASLRKELAKKSNTQLYALLTELDPARAATIDQQNPRRLIRAIEIARVLGQVPAISYDAPDYKSLVLGLHLPKEVLDARIKERVYARGIKKMLLEIKALHESGISLERLETFGLEFKCFSALFAKKLSEDQAVEKLYFDTIHYAKRQITWWKRNPEIVWLAPSETMQAEKLLQEFLAK